MLANQPVAMSQCDFELSTPPRNAVAFWFTARAGLANREGTKTDAYCYIGLDMTGWASVSLIAET